MRKILITTFVLLLSIALNGFSLERSDLSPEAAALVKETGFVTIVMKDGTKVEGALISETAEKIVVRIKVGATASMAREIIKTSTQSIKKADVEGLLASKLLTFKLDPKNSLLEQDYRKAIALFDEFLSKCAGHSDADAVSSLRKDFADELKRIEKGMAKVDGEWLTPVCATVKRFNLISEQIETLGKRPDFTTNPKVKEYRDSLVEKRRLTARSLPKMIQDHLPRLIEGKEFDDAVAETTAFLHFWIEQVIKSEGKAEDVIKGMDFDYILRMQKSVVDAYKGARLGNDKPAKSPADKDMIYVPGGYFLMGSDSTDPKNDAFPAHIVFVSPFLIDKYEVSNEDYRKFVEHVKKTGDSSMEHPSAPPLKKHDAEGWKTAGLAGDRQPVVGVDWFDAFAYSKWIGKRLPSEAEWEKAARGMDQRKFAWGDKAVTACAASWSGGRELFVKEIDRQIPKVPPPPPPSSGCGCFMKKEEPPPPPPPTHIPDETWDVDKLMPVLAVKNTDAGKFDWNQNEFTNDISVYGLLHMSGNAAEWVNDSYSNRYYGVSAMRDPAGPVEGNVHVFRGGSYLSSKPDELAVYLRGHPLNPKMESGSTSEGRPFIGFRCAKSISIVVQPVVPAVDKERKVEVDKK